MKETMMKSLLLASVLFAVPSASAFDVALQNRDGTPYRRDGQVELTVERMQDVCGAETIRCRVVSLCDRIQMLRIVASDEFKGATVLWDGKDEVKPSGRRISVPLYMNFRFLMVASWNESAGVALAAGAEDFNSYVDGILDGDMRSISVHATLTGKGSEYVCSFHRVPFSPKYGIREAYARYYRLYPERFFKNPDVYPGYYGICAEYASWQSPNPDICRFMNATWEWCHGADRTWGDLLNSVNPSGKNSVDYKWVDLKYFKRGGGKLRKVASAKITKERFDEIQGSRFSNGYYCGVANGFYTMTLANISKKHAAPHPDSHATVNGFGLSAYHYTTEVFAFPECSWGVELRRQLAELMPRWDLGGMAFDVASARSVYRGERLKAMKNVSWDEFGPGVVRGVANAKIFEYLHTLKNSRLPGCAGAAVNTRYQHVSDMLYADTVMHETTPWDHQLPFPMHSRLALGEKALTLWEGYSPKSFDPNYAKWPAGRLDMLKNDLGRFAVHRSLAACASLSVRYTSEYVAKMSHAFVRLNAAGWKPVIGAKPECGECELTRYGLGDRSFIAVCNLTNLTRKIVMDVYPDEIATGLVGAKSDAKGFLYVPFYGGAADSTFGDGRMRVSVSAGALLANVLEAVATVDGEGMLSASWEGDGCGRMTLMLKSGGFRGKVVCRDAIEGYRLSGPAALDFKGGETVRLAYCDASLAAAADAIGRLCLSDLSKLAVEHSADADSREIAERFRFFFRSAGKKDGEKSGPAVGIAENREFARLGVRIGELEVFCGDRLELSHFARRVLNVLNAKRYPSYGPKPKMDPWDARHFTFLRY